MVCTVTGWQVDRIRHEPPALQLSPHDPQLASSWRLVHVPFCASPQHTASQHPPPQHLESPPHWASLVQPVEQDVNIDTTARGDVLISARNVANETIPNVVRPRSIPPRD